jgi:uncharacterized membrane protein HdeD (DUF308 family)
LAGASLAREELEALTWGWWLSLLIGALAVVAGIIVLLKPSNSLTTLAVVSGILILVDGIVELVAAVIGGSENRGLMAVIGALSVIAGVLLIRHPLGGVKAVALVLGIWLIAAGVVRFVAALVVPGGRVWRICVALVLAIFGIIIVSSPHIGYATLALLTGVCFIGYGLAMLAVGWTMHAVRHAPASPEPEPSAST